MSETVDSGNVSGDDEDDADDDFDESDDDVIPASKDFDEFHVDLCHGCSKSLPLVRLLRPSLPPYYGYYGIAKFSVTIFGEISSLWQNFQRLFTDMWKF